MSRSATAANARPCAGRSTCECATGISIRLRQQRDTWKNSKRTKGFCRAPPPLELASVGSVRMLARDQLGNCRGFSGSSLARLSRESPQKKVAFAFPELDRHHAPCSVFKTRPPGQDEMLSFTGRCTKKKLEMQPAFLDWVQNKSITFTCKCFLCGMVCATASLSTPSKIVTSTAARCLIFQKSTPRRSEVLDFCPWPKNTCLHRGPPAKYNVILYATVHTLSYNII